MKQKYLSIDIRFGRECLYSCSGNATKEQASKLRDVIVEAINEVWPEEEKGGTPCV